MMLFKLGTVSSLTIGMEQYSMVKFLISKAEAMKLNFSSTRMGMRAWLVFPTRETIQYLRVRLEIKNWVLEAKHR